MFPYKFLNKLAKFHQNQQTKQTKKQKPVFFLNLDYTGSIDQFGLPPNLLWSSSVSLFKVLAFVKI